MTVETEVSKPEKAAQIAKDFIEKSKPKAEEKPDAKPAATEEPKGAAAGEKPEIEKTEGKADDKPKEPAPAEKKVNEDKVGERKAEIQKEIDTLTAQKKALQEEVGSVSELATRNKENQLKIEALEKQMAEVTKPQKQANLQEDIKKKRDERISKYLNDDKDKAREERREMTKDQFNDWFLEDPEGANDWQIERNHRRRSEEDTDSKSFENGSKAEEFVKRQNISRDRLLQKFPELEISKRGNELVAQGKTQEEATEIILSENKSFKLMMEIISENQDKYMGAPDGPELVMAEMEKRMVKPSNGKDKKTYTEEELDQIVKEKMEMEKQRIASIDNGTGSSAGKPKPSVRDSDPAYQQQLSIALKKGYTKEQLDRSIDRRKTITGANQLEAGDRK